MGAAASAKSRPPAPRRGAKSAAGRGAADVERPTFNVLVRARTPRHCGSRGLSARMLSFPLRRRACGLGCASHALGMRCRWPDHHGYRTSSGGRARAGDLAAGPGGAVPFGRDYGGAGRRPAAAARAADSRRRRSCSGSGSTPRCCAGATAPPCFSSNASGTIRPPSRTSTSCRCRLRGCGGVHPVGGADPHASDPTSSAHRARKSKQSCWTWSGG